MSLLTAQYDRMLGFVHLGWPARLAGMLPAHHNCNGNQCRGPHCRRILRYALVVAPPAGYQCMRCAHGVFALVLAPLRAFARSLHFRAHARIEHFAPAPVDGAPLIGLPVVLVHGFWGFDRIGPRRTALRYFRRAATHLAGLGVLVYTVRLPTGHSVKLRAQRLAAMIEANITGQVVIIGHSLGGLDARYVAARTLVGAQVAAVITVGTPHADIFDGGRLRWPYRLARFLRFPVAAVSWLSTAGAARFNREVPDVAGVYYASVISARRQTGALRSPMSPMLRPMHWYLQRTGPNDGVVPLESQRWGEVLLESEVDHLAQIGWGRGSPGFVAHDMYAAIVGLVGQRLATRAITTAPVVSADAQ